MKGSRQCTYTPYNTSQTWPCSQASPLWNGNIEVVQAYTYSYSRVGEPGNEIITDQFSGEKESFDPFI